MAIMRSEKMFEMKKIRRKILVIHGPNINLLGEREISIYGKETFESVNNQIIEKAQQMNLICDVYHSNLEGNIISKIQKAKGNYDGIVINAGAYSHYSYAIRDAVAAVKIPTIEVHMSNIYNREEFRQKSVLAAVCAGQIVGFGKHSYFLAIYGLNEIM